jgi:hypothetical protein
MTNPLFSFFTAFVHMTFGKTFLHGPSGPRSDSRREFPTPEKHFDIFLHLPEHGLYATLHGNSTNRSEKMGHIFLVEGLGVRLLAMGSIATPGAGPRRATF